jgi:hypothetical protein
MDPRYGTALRRFLSEVRPLVVPFYHAARACVCCRRCGPVGDPGFRAKAQALLVLLSGSSRARNRSPTCTGKMTPPLWAEAGF